jgi:hypothetical protein
MTALEQLKRIKDEQYVTADGETFRITLKEGLTDDQIDQLAARLPAAQIPQGIRELLRFTSGFSFVGLDEVCFDGACSSEYEKLFPASVPLAGDGAGNFWIVDVNPQGEWGPVFFVCHDPAVVVKQSEDVSEFIEQIDELGKKPDQSTLSLFLERTLMRIYGQEDGFMDIATARNSEDIVLRDFAQGLPDHFAVADLRNKPIQTGFAWGKWGPEIDGAVRHSAGLLWGFETKAKKGARLKNGVPAARLRPWWKFWR